MEEFQAVATHHSWPPWQFPEIIHKQRTIQKIKMTEHNNLQPASGNHLTWGGMKTISLSQARVNLFCWGRKKGGNFAQRYFFLFAPNSAICFLPSVIKQHESCRLRIFWKRRDPVYLAPASRASLAVHYWDHWDSERSYLWLRLSALAYLRQEDPRPHTDWSGEGAQLLIGIFPSDHPTQLK